MKIAITSSGKDLSATVDQRFGRAKYFLIYDLEKDTFEILDNSQVLDSAQGAGIQAAQHVVDAGVEILLSGHCGPNAFKVLNAGKVRVLNRFSGNIEAAIAAYRAGDIEDASQADVEGHWV